MTGKHTSTGPRRGRTAAAFLAVATLAGVLSASVGAGAQTSAGPALQARVPADKSSVAAQQADPASLRILLKFREGSGVRLRGGTFVTTVPKVSVAAVNA